MLVQSSNDSKASLTDEDRERQITRIINYKILDSAYDLGKLAQELNISIPEAERIRQDGTKEELRQTAVRYMAIQEFKTIQQIEAQAKHAVTPAPTATAATTERL
jgi:hypothetical protein